MLSSQAPMRRPAAAARRPRKPSASRTRSQTPKHSETCTRLLQGYKELLLSLHENVVEGDMMRDALLSSLKMKMLSLVDCFQLFLEVTWKDRYRSAMIAKLFHELTQLDDDDTTIVEGLTLLLEKGCNELLNSLTLLRTPTASQLGLVTLLANLYNLEDLPEMHREGVESYLIDIAKAFWPYFMPSAPVCLNNDPFIDAVCDILSAVGRTLDVDCPVNMERTFNRITVLLFSDEVSQYARMRLMEIKEARAARWSQMKSASKYYKDAYFKHLEQNSFDSGRPDSPSSLSSGSSNDDVFIQQDSTMTNSSALMTDNDPADVTKSPMSVDTEDTALANYYRDDSVVDNVASQLRSQSIGEASESTEKEMPLHHLRAKSLSTEYGPAKRDSAGRGFHARGGFGHPLGMTGSEGEAEQKTQSNIGRSYSEDSKHTGSGIGHGGFQSLGNSSNWVPGNNQHLTDKSQEQQRNQTQHGGYSAPEKRVFIRAQSLTEDLTGHKSKGGSRFPGMHSLSEDSGVTEGSDEHVFRLNQNKLQRHQSGGFPVTGSEPQRTNSRSLSVDGQSLGSGNGFPLLGNEPRRPYINARSLSEDASVKRGFGGHSSGSGVPHQRSQSETMDSRLGVPTRFSAWHTHWGHGHRNKLEFPVNEAKAGENTTDPSRYSRDFLLSFALCPIAMTRPEDLTMNCKEDWVFSVISPTIKTVKDCFNGPAGGFPALPKC